MAETKKTNALKARLPRGLVDRHAGQIKASERMLATIRGVYERYGFEPVETPLIEYTDALGKFLPDQDRPNEGVFSFQDDDEQWLSLRYDLTAPLARYVAENFDALPKPYRSYRQGWVFRNEKPGPGRFRQFMQFDADTVGAASPAADAEMCMMMADTLEELGIPRGQYVIRVNNRKVLDGVLETIGLAGDDNAGRRLAVLRAIDKADKFGFEGVALLLGAGRRDESGDFTKGAGLTQPQIEVIADFIGELRDRNISRSGDWSFDYRTTLKRWRTHLADSPTGLEGVGELEAMSAIFRSSGYESRIDVTSEVVRGLEYYTGPVFEAELLFETVNDKGEPARFGSVGGGGRYDGLVGRFRSEPVPATGFSIGVSRLMAALSALGKIDVEAEAGPVVVTVFDRSLIGNYQRIVSMLRESEYVVNGERRRIRAELYLGDSKKLGPQLKYADKRNSPCVIIQGSDELNKEGGSVVQIKDLARGKELASQIEDHATYVNERPAQFEVPEANLVAAVRAILERGG